SGACTCPAGYSGSTCDKLTRDSYTSSYKGDGVDSDGESYKGVTMSFTPVDSDITMMKIDLKDEAGVLINSFDIQLMSDTIFEIIPKTEAGNTYSGSGTISSDQATLKINITGNI